MSYNYLPLDSKPLQFQQIKHLLDYDQLVSITFDAHEKIMRCRDFLDQKMKEPGKMYYGVNTGFGYLQNVQISLDQIEQLQYNLIVSHACGLGEEVPKEIVKLMVMLKIKQLSYGHSGVQIQTVIRLMDMYNNDILPVIYTQGSLGASGDLAPLSHLSLSLLGLGEVYFKGEKMAASAALKKMNWEPIHLQSKEGLALINGTQFMNAYGLYCLKKAEQLLEMANLIAALSIDAFDCVIEPYHPSIHKIRGHQGQIDTAASIQCFLYGSEIAIQPKTQVQDPYSFRCIPQVHGASIDAFKHVLGVFMQEVNAVTDNPNIFPDEDLIVSGGNFHGQPLAINLDYLCIAMSEIASISERRTYQLISGQRNLPMFLVKNAGLNSGFMIPQYTAAGIVSENKQLCTPASVDSISSSNNQEDHVSMGANAATKCYRLMHNVEKVLGIELLTAAQALDFRRPLKTSPILETLMTEFRKVVCFNDADRILHTDMINSINFIANYKTHNSINK
ncbi:histidine ammonia-lyase [Sediminibacterium sp.]|jgi:histidine ammonia-lyase|uniref:histidine ammonia-lyase n=1 Tax=Sediminibacterium sp. TaxID=1917865 RepID=UPI0025E7FDAC|nr:histidine ammonia-lyase [Sediminibacterium sp.]MBT9485887.1 histidine ammonia-lyase [Sediminibacterium sp.]